MNVVVPITITEDKLINSTLQRNVILNDGVITYPDYDSGFTYKKDQYVKVGDLVYRSLLNNNLNNDPVTDVANGANGLGTYWVVWGYLESSWSSEDTYSIGDLVSPAGGSDSVYVSTSNNNTNNPPITDVNGGEGRYGSYWELYGPVEWVSGEAVAIGDIRSRSQTNKIYQALQASSSFTPEDNPTYWQELFPINQYKMFDSTNGTESEAFLTATVRIRPKEIVTSVSAFNLSNVYSFNIKMVDPTAGEVYNNTITMDDNTEVTDWYQYYFADIDQITEFVVSDLPTYPNAYIEVTMSVDTGVNYLGSWADILGGAGVAGNVSVYHQGKIWNLTQSLDNINTEEPTDVSDFWTEVGGSHVKVGTLLFGRVFELGTTEYGTSIQLLDFSRKDTDEFGNFTITPRRNSKLVDFEGYVEKSRTSYLFRKLRELTTTPCVWYGTGTLPTDDPTIVYGYYRDSRINLSNPATTDVTIQIEGLI